MVRKYDDAINWTFYISRGVFEKARLKSAQTGVSLSSVVNDALEKFVQSEEVDLEQNYEKLQREFVILIAKSKRLTKMLKEMGVYDRLLDLAEDLGLDMDMLANVNEVIAKLMLMENGEVGRSELHLFISLLEVTKKRIEVASQLEAFRKRKYLSSGEVNVVSSVPETHSLQGVGSMSEMRKQKASENP